MILLLLSLLLFAYPVWRVGAWIQLPVWLNLLFTIPAFLSQFIARVVMRNRQGKWVYACRGAADFFLGLTPVLIICVLMGELGIAVLSWSSTPVGLGVLLITGLTGVWGLAKAWTPDVVEIQLRSHKLTRPLRFAQISDVHIGSRTSRFLNHIIDLVNAQQPDFLCITGDFIDQPDIGVDKLSPLKKFKGPIYYCIGNHERYEDLDKIIVRLESLGIEVLRDRAIEVGEIQVIGIDDHQSSKQVGRILPSIDVRQDLYSILLYHRPQGLSDASEHGIDLKLSGHTHAGQIVPFHLAVNKVFEYRKGLYRHDKTYLYVNEGTGTWGPTLRLGTRSEITLFEISPLQSEMKRSTVEAITPATVI
ncbi:MAG: metallophosphoesterase [Pseudomonadota bacterium]